MPRPDRCSPPFVPALAGHGAWCSTPESHTTRPLTMVSSLAVAGMSPQARNRIRKTNVATMALVVEHTKASIVSDISLLTWTAKLCSRKACSTLPRSHNHRCHAIANYVDAGSQHV